MKDWRWGLITEFPFLSPQLSELLCDKCLQDSSEKLSMESHLVHFSKHPWNLLPRAISVTWFLVLSQTLLVTVSFPISCPGDTNCTLQPALSLKTRRKLRHDESLTSMGKLFYSRDLCPLVSLFAFSVTIDPIV